jgi:hypothetical protein
MRTQVFLIDRKSAQPARKPDAGQSAHHRLVQRQTVYRANVQRANGARQGENLAANQAASVGFE